MIKHLKIFFFLFCFINVAYKSYSQDLHFSQFFNNPLLTNPANTGFIPDADYRLGASYRNQYSNIMAQPYKTMSIYGDAQVFRDRIVNGWMGLGGVILRDVAGTGSLTSTQIYASVAYHQMLGLSSLLTAGFNLGWANKRIDPTNLTFPDQFDGRFFDSNLPSEAKNGLLNTSVSYFDMQAGLNYAYFPTKNIYINAGYSIQHVNRPKETFFGDDAGSILALRHIGFLNGIFKMSDVVIINPAAYYTNMAGASEFVLGMNAAYNLTGDGNKQIIAGLFYRYNDAVIPMIALQISNIRFTFSYDVTTSSLKNFNQSLGAQEFNVLDKGFYDQFNGDKKQAMCPVF